MSANEKLNEVLENDGTVHRLWVSGASLEDIVVCLANEKAAQFKRFTEMVGRLSAIAPRKIKAEDGKFYIYRCPANLVPETVL